MSELNETYKKRHKPQRQTEKQKFHQGYFYPTLHPEKCLSKTNIWRSEWERKFYAWCDANPRVLRWASEPIAVDYLNPMTNFEYCIKNNLDWKNPIYWARAKYYIDVWIELQNEDGKSVSKIFIEIKPYNQSVPPKPLPQNPKRTEVKTYNRLASQYLVNKQKWDAATKFCQERGAIFQVFTEVELKKLGILH